MVAPDSHKISRIPWYSGFLSPRSEFQLQDYHLLRSSFPADSSILYGSFLRSYNPYTYTHRFGLLPFRSPLLRESLSISFPPATKMFQFAGYAPTSWVTAHYGCRVPPFGYLRIIALVQLPEAFRSFSRPSSLYKCLDIPPMIQVIGVCCIQIKT